MLEPVSVGLKFAFLAVLYLFLLWVVRSALQDMRRGVGPSRSAAQVRGGAPAAPEATGIHSASRPGEHSGGELAPRLVVESAPGHEPGVEYDIPDEATLGRGDVEIHLEDGFASGRHARLIRQGQIIVLEDLGSTNGTYLNEELVRGPQPLHAGDRIRIGDSKFTYDDS